jgi:hypothetical protein
VSPNPESILDSVKKAVGLDSTDTTFDLDVTLLINSTFGALKQLGVGSDSGFIIQDNTTLWSQYISGLSYLGMVKHFIFMSVKLAFDPPDGRYALPAFQAQIEQLAWRINVEVEHLNPPTDPFGTAGSDTFQDGVMKTYIAPAVVQLEFASTVTPDASAGNVFYLTMTGNCTINAPVNASDGEHITLEITSGGHAVTWGSGWGFGDAGTPVLSVDGKADIVSGYYKETAASWRAGFTTGF